MALDFEEVDEAPRRPIGLGIVGVLLLIAAGYVYYGVLQQRPEAKPVPFDYQYTVTQKVDTDVQYNGSSFFENGGPNVTDTAYVTNLTKAIDATFHYNYKASEARDLKYSYDVKAIVKGTYPLKNDGSSVPKVWSKEYVLVYPETKTTKAKNFSLNPSVTIPFTDYAKDIDEFNKTLELLLNGEVVVSFTVRVSGNVEGTEFNDVKVSTITAPLDQQIYQLAVKYDKKKTNQVAAPATKNSWNISEHYEEILAASLAIVGLILLIVGFRKQIFKSPYQRELDRIYRLHDGIIIRASKSADLTGKNIVSVKTFDDMLNLEEELKVPIVASPAGNDGTRFIIMRDDVAYVYALGNVLIEDETVNEVDANDLEEAKKPVPKKRPLNQASRRKIQ